MTIPSNPLLIHKSHPEVHSSVTQNTHLTTCYPRETLHRDPLFHHRSASSVIPRTSAQWRHSAPTSPKGFLLSTERTFQRHGLLFCLSSILTPRKLPANPLPDRQQLHVNDCVWEVIYDELKQTLESTDILHRSTNVSPPPTQSTPNYHPSSDFEPFKKTTTDASTQTPTRLTRTKPTTVEKSSNTNIDSCA